MGSLTDVDETHIVLVQPDRVTLPREREASVSNEEATLRASGDVEVELDSGSQTEGDEGGGEDGDEEIVLLVQEPVRQPRGRTTRRSGSPERGRAKDDASSTAVTVATGHSRRSHSSPPVLERPHPLPTARVEEPAPLTAASETETGEQTSPTSRSAATQTDMEDEEVPEPSPAVEVADAQTETSEEEVLESPTPQSGETQTEEEGKTAPEEVEAEAEAEAEAETQAEAEAEAGGMALISSSGTAFPIVREDPDAGSMAFRPDRCGQTLGTCCEREVRACRCFGRTKRVFFCCTFECI